MGEVEEKVGRDEMNLAEFPITLLSDRVPRDCKTLTFGGLTISGSDAHGLPTAVDADVVLGLIQLTKITNNFTQPMVKFNRYMLLSILGWPIDGPHYRRLDASL